MKWFFFFSCLLLSCSSPRITQADTQQTEDEDEFAFARSDHSKKASIGFIETKAYQQTYQYQVAKTVFDRLIAAKGDYSKRVPTLILSDAVKKVAVAKPRKAEVILELKAYEACRKLGKDSLNALAALLGHELIHIYNEHDWKRHFAASQSDTLEAVQRIKDMNDGLQLELQSDHLGGLLGYAAGYETLDIMPRLMDTLYNFYPLPKKSNKNYPSLEERKKIAQESMQSLQDKIQVFETANYLIALEQYDAAKYYLEFILKDFQSRELYNNLGVVCTQAAMQLLGPEALKFAFPVELDGASRLVRGGTRAGFSRPPEADELLNRAIDYFKQASLLDKNYPPALLNLACAYTLLSHDEVDHYRRANFYAEEAAVLSKDAQWSKTKADVKVLQGIIADRQDDTDQAKSNFVKAREMGSPLAAINLLVLEDKSLIGPPDSNETTVFGFAESNGKMRLPDFNIDRGVVQLFQGKLDVKNVVAVDKKRKANCGLAIHEHSKSYIHGISRNEYLFVQVSDANEGSIEDLNVSIGDLYPSIIKKYGNPNRQVETTHSSILIYYGQGLIIEINEDQQVSKMGVYRLKTP